MTDRKMILLCGSCCKKFAPDLSMLLGITGIHSCGGCGIDIHWQKDDYGHFWEHQCHDLPEEGSVVVLPPRMGESVKKDWDHSGDGRGVGYYTEKSIGLKIFDVEESDG